MIIDRAQSKEIVHDRYCDRVYAVLIVWQSLLSRILVLSKLKFNWFEVDSTAEEIAKVPFGLVCLFRSGQLPVSSNLNCDYC